MRQPVGFDIETRRDQEIDLVADFFGRIAVDADQAVNYLRQVGTRDRRRRALFQERCDGCGSRFGPEECDKRGRIKDSQRCQPRRS